MKPPTIIKGSILDFKGDCIVNPANSFLRHDGGLAAVIAGAATASIHLDDPQRPSKVARRSQWSWDHQVALDPVPVATGNAVATSAGLLPYKAVIHAVGPVWNGGHFCEASLLLSAHAEALHVAEVAGCRSIAFPALSCGIFGFPVEKAARLAVTVLRHTALDVSVYLMDDAHVAAYEAALVG